MSPTRPKIATFVVDAFASEPFRGNPAGVCVLERKLDDALMQKIAMEMNHAETAFVVRLELKPVSDCSRFSLRWFTPQVEVDLCGHATLATAATIFKEYASTASRLSFETKSGTLTVERKGESEFEMDFPTQAVFETTAPAGLIDALGVGAVEALHVAERSFYVVRVPESVDLTKLKPDFSKLIAVTLNHQAHGVIVTRKGPNPFDFSSRMFAPWIGINEDPVTGAAHTVLTPYWRTLLKKEKMMAYQASARGGEVGVNLSGNRVLLTGRAVVVLRGELLV